MKLSKEGREYFRWPFWGLDSQTPDIRVGSSEWVPLTADADYEPAEPVAVGALWFRALIAGPLATGNPGDTIVVTEPSRIRFRVTDNPEVFVSPDDQWIHLFT